MVYLKDGQLDVKQLSIWVAMEQPCICTVYVRVLVRKQISRRTFCHFIFRTFQTDILPFHFRTVISWSLPIAELPVHCSNCQISKVTFTWWCQYIAISNRALEILYIAAADVILHIAIIYKGSFPKNTVKVNKPIHGLNFFLKQCVKGIQI